MCLVCYSPKKRESLQQVFASQSPVKIVGTKKNRKNVSVRILRIIAYLGMQELLLLIICPSHSIHQWEITVHMESPEIKVKYQIQPVNNEDKCFTCKNCKMTTLASIFQTKLVSQMMIKADQTKLENFTCFCPRRVLAQRPKPEEAL